MSKKIKFSSKIPDYPDIKTSKSFIPQWYKDIDSSSYKNIEFLNNIPNPTVKACMPFLDSLTSGYMLLLPCDVHFEKLSDGSHYVRWGSSDITPIEFRSNEKNKIPTPTGYSDFHYAWRHFYSIKTPNDYSLIVTHPFNRFDLPFLTLTGIADSDIALSPGNLPFFIKNDFSGVIEEGTPIAQIIPIKRDSWKIEKDDSVIAESDSYRHKINRKFIGYYKNNIWKKKKYD